MSNFSSGDNHLNDKVDKENSDSDPVHLTIFRLFYENIVGWPNAKLSCASNGTSWPVLFIGMLFFRFAQREIQ